MNFGKLMRGCRGSDAFLTAGKFLGTTCTASQERKIKKKNQHLIVKVIGFSTGEENFQ